MKQVELKCPECKGEYFAVKVTWGYNGIPGWVPRANFKCVACGYTFNGDNYKPTHS